METSVSPFHALLCNIYKRIYISVEILQIVADLAFLALFLQKALELTRLGAYLLFLDMPEGCQVGIDYRSYVVGPKFKGIKMIPPGVHYLFYRFCLLSNMLCSLLILFFGLHSSTNSKNDGGSGAPPLGFFVALQSQEVLVRKWDKETEMLLPLEDSSNESAYAEGLLSLCVLFILLFSISPSLILGVRKFEFDSALAPYPLDTYQKWTGLASLITKEVRLLSPFSLGFEHPYLLGC
jgi:A1 cistron-splicing factor AAR2